MCNVNHHKHINENQKLDLNAWSLSKPETRIDENNPSEDVKPSICPLPL